MSKNKLTTLLAGMKGDLKILYENLDRKEREVYELKEKIRPRAG